MVLGLIYNRTLGSMRRSWIRKTARKGQPALPLHRFDAGTQRQQSLKDPLERPDETKKVKGKMVPTMALVPGIA